MTQSEDTWVTVFGFSPDDLALVLQVSCLQPVFNRMYTWQTTLCTLQICSTNMSMCCCILLRCLRLPVRVSCFPAKLSA